MSREDIIRMAREAGFPDCAMGLASEDAGQKTERFAALVAAAEREACAKIIYGLCISDNNAQEIVNAIRARGGK